MNFEDLRTFIEFNLHECEVMMLCRWCVFHFLFENLNTKIFASTPHIILQHSPPLDAVIFFI